MVCYLKGLGNKKPPEGGLFEFEVNSCTHRERNSPMCIGNTDIVLVFSLLTSVYPYVYREHGFNGGGFGRCIGLSLCV